MLDDDAIRSIARSAGNYRRGLFCPSELWGQVLGCLTTEDVEDLLDRLPPDARDLLRGAYHERPSSLQLLSGHGVVRRVVEEWCRRG